MDARDLYFTRDEMDAAWRAIRPLNCDDDLDTAVLGSALMAMLIRCKALATRRARQGLTAPSYAHAFRLGNPRPTTRPRHKPRPLAPFTARAPDLKQRAANDLDLLEETPP